MIGQSSAISCQQKILCRHFNECGGCDSQDIVYEEQLIAKQNRVEKLLGRKVERIVPSPGIWHYRNKMEYAVGGESASPSVGLRQKRRFYRIVDLAECRIFSEDFGRLSSTVKSWIKENGIDMYDFRRHAGGMRYVAVRHSKSYNELMVLAVSASPCDKFGQLAESLKKIPNVKSVYGCTNSGVADVALSKELFLLYGEEYIKEKVNGIDYLIYPSTFFQTNSLCCERLYKEVQSSAAGLGGKALDLYCGSGGIALQLAGSFESVAGVDNSEANIKYAAENARINNITNVEFIRADAEKFLLDLKKSGALSGFSAITVDPPRSGLGKRTAALVADSSIPNLIYVSCNPDSLKSDLELLSPAYSVLKIVPVDMFPHTRHLETVVVLRYNLNN